MNTDQLLIFALVAVILAGLTLVVGFVKARLKAVQEKARDELLPDLAILRDRVQRSESALAEAETEIEQSQNEILMLKKHKSDLDIKLAISEEKLQSVSNLKVELEKKDKSISTLIDEKILLESKVAELKTTIEKEREKVSERLSDLQDAKVEMINQFKTLAQEILEEKSQKFTMQNHEKLDGLLSPFKEEISGFRKKVDEVYNAEGKERATLRHELEQLRKLNSQVSQDTKDLTKALKGDKKIQGNWGELILERVLEQSGLRKGVEYETQAVLRDSDDKIKKPDVIIHLPDGKDVVVDSKVSLVDYERYCSADDEGDQQAFLKEHINSVRRHIDGLADKDYSSLKGLHSLDFVLMFMPIEAAFMAAVQSDADLFNYAFNHRIVVVTPSTLLATLKTIENVWRYEHQSRNALDIVQKAGAIYDKFRGFVVDMEKLGKQFNTAQNTYDDAMKKLTHGKGNLISQAQQFVDLGVKVKKELPKSITENAEIEIGPENDEDAERSFSKREAIMASSE